ncbi:undecaprenyl-diphosphatase [Peribacillus sp. SCS-37]|uniref:undecaprenyl-diphosphatase n=1 Tax=Paraperibacillus esterisolvens TaxID=3115296 RepID=UPI0039063246
MNYELFQHINSLAGHSGLLDTVMVTMSDSVPYVAIALLLYLCFLGNRQHGIERRYTALYAAFSSGIALCLNAIIHIVYYHPRPFVSHHVHKLVPHAADSSFVSDHTVLVFALAWTLVMRNDRLKYLIFIWAAFVGVSRIYVGVHYPADVLGGVLFSCAASGLIIYFSRRLEPFVQLLFRLYDQFMMFISLFSREKHQNKHKKDV